MELSLNIYDKKNRRKVVKTYRTETIDLSFGVVEDIVDILDLETLKTGDEKELGMRVIRCFGQLKPFMEDLFEGLTDEEIRTVRTSDIINVFTGLFVYVTEELLGMGGSKN